MKKIVFIGAGKGAQIALVLFNDMLQDDANYGIHDYVLHGFVDDNPLSSVANLTNLGTYGLYVPQQDHVLFCTSSKMDFRRSSFSKYKNHKWINLPTLQGTHCKYGVNNFVFDGVYFGFFSTIGSNNVISSMRCINHHCEIGDGNLFGPGCMLSGSVKIGNNNTFGAGVLIQNGITIGDNCSIASGAIITGNITTGTRIISHNLNYSIYDGTYEIREKVK